jgi:hypothetical protein
MQIVNTMFLDAMYDYRAAFISNDIEAMSEALSRSLSTDLTAEDDSLLDYMHSVAPIEEMRANMSDINFLNEMIESNYQLLVLNDYDCESFVSARLIEMIKERI